MAKKKKKKKRIKFPSIFTLIFLAFIVYVAITMTNQYQLLFTLKEEQNLIEKEKNQLTLEVKSLNSDVEMLNDPERFLKVVEKIARDEYKMVKPYETMYIDKNKNENKFIKGIGDE